MRALLLRDISSTVIVYLCRDTNRTNLTYELFGVLTEMGRKSILCVCMSFTEVAYARGL